MDRVSLTAVDRLIPDIYEAAFHPAAWRDVLVAICGAFGAAGGELVNAGIALQDRWVMHQFPEHLVERYVEELADSDTVVPAIMAQAARQPVAFRFSEIPGLMRMPLYDAIVKPFGMDTLCLAALGNDSGTGFEFIALGRGRRQRDFDGRAVAALARLKPHLRSAGIVQMRLEEAGEPFRAVVQGMTSAAIVLSRNGRILLANAAAERLLKRGDGLTTRGGELGGATPAESARLKAAIVRAAADGGRGGTPEGSDLTLRRPSGKLPLAVHVASLGRGNPLPAGGRRAAVGVFIQDPERPVATEAGRLRAVYGLTAAEARVALALAEGHAPAEIAERFGTSPKTVRTQVEALFAKMGVRRQAQAVQRVLALPRSFAAPADQP